jgi:hypothetical protein
MMNLALITAKNPAKMSTAAQAIQLSLMTNLLLTAIPKTKAIEPDAH